MDSTYWSFIAEVKTAVNKLIETKRNDGVIGKSLSASITLYCEQGLFEQLERLQDELRFVLITSSAVVTQETPPDHAEATDVEGLFVVVEANKNKKCARCWHQRSDVGQYPQHPELCGRCIENVDGDGEIRYFA